MGENIGRSPVSYLKVSVKIKLIKQPLDYRAASYLLKISSEVFSLSGLRGKLKRYYGLQFNKC